MKKRTFIRIPISTRDRLRKFGGKGQTYEQILENLMSRVEYEEYMEEQYKRLAERHKFVSLEQL